MAFRAGQHLADIVPVVDEVMSFHCAGFRKREGSGNDWPNRT